MSSQMPSTFVPTEASQIAPGIYKTSIDGLLYINKSLFPDNRGFFSEIVRLPEVEAVTGVKFDVRQVNHARSEQNVVRGVHAEGWNKCTFITRGKAFCALADVRPNSKTFLAKEYFLLGEGEDALSGVLFLPSGIGNSLCVIEGPVDYIYLVDRLYKDRDTSGDAAISLFDADLAIEWPIPREQMIISQRDASAITLREKAPEKFK